MLFRSLNYSDCHIVTQWFLPLLFDCNLVTPQWKQALTDTATHTPPFPVCPAPHRREVTALPSRSHTNVTTNQPLQPTEAPGHHGTCSAEHPILLEKARLHQNTTPISTFARRAPSSNLNKWEERVRPQKPLLSPRISPFKNQLCRKKGEYA